MRKPPSTPNQPMRVQPCDASLRLASVRKVLMGLCRPARPSSTSAIMIGTPMATMQREIHNNERTAAILASDVGELPDVA